MIAAGLSELCTSPRLFVKDDFLSPDEIARLIALTTDDALEARGVKTKHDFTGLSCEFPVDADPIVGEIVERIQALLGMHNDFGGTLRFRRYAPDEFHPPHIDEYQIGDLFLIATATLYLSDTEAGGETSFPRAKPKPVQVESRSGRLAIWFNHGPDGEVDPASYHEGLPVLSGEKVTLTNFIYKPKRFARTAPDERIRFYCVNDGVPTETTDLLREACDRRRVAYIEVEAQRFDFDPGRQLEGGDLLYRPAISTAAMRVEQFLFAPGVATFYRYDDSMFFDALTSPLHFQRAGLPVPRTVYCSNGDRGLMKRFVEQLGGFPIVLKLLGGSSGIGVMRADSLPALYSLVDYALSQGRNPLLCAYVDDAVHWRVVVIGERAVAAYKNPRDEDDFRTYGGTDPGDVTADPPAQLAEIAVRALKVLQNEFGGVDLLVHSSGRCYLLEANFPCYFPHAQQIGGIDVAGMMLDYLLEKRARLASNPRLGVRAAG